MEALLIDTYLVVPMSRSFVKVKYQGDSFKKNDVFGGVSVSQTPGVFNRLMLWEKKKMLVTTMFLRRC